jgi:hypothetical protein
MSNPTPETAAAPPDELLAAGHRTWSRLDAFHVIGFFANETRERYKAVHLRPRYAYFVSRVAPMGPVPASVCAAVFYVFNPRLVEEAMDGAWSVVSPEKVLAERYAGTREALDRVLVDVAAQPGHAERLEEAAALARRACGGLSMQGRALAAGYASLPWPDDPLMALWHAAGIIREHRGDGHIAALVTAPLDPVEAILTAGLDTGTTQFMRETRGWDDAEWAAAGQRLAARGLLHGGERSHEGSDVGELTDAGVALRRTLELQTDLAAAAAWTHLGLEGTQRLGELMRPLTRAVVTSGVLPAGLGAPRR